MANVSPTAQLAVSFPSPLSARALVGASFGARVAVRVMPLFSTGSSSSVSLLLQAAKVRGIAANAISFFIMYYPPFIKGSADRSRRLHNYSGH